MSVLGKLPPRKIAFNTKSNPVSNPNPNINRGQLSGYQIPDTGYQYVLKKLLFNTIIVFTSIYLESYCKIPAWLDLIDQYYSLFTTKIIYMLKTF